MTGRGPGRHVETPRCELAAALRQIASSTRDAAACTATEGRRCTDRGRWPQKMGVDHRRRTPGRVPAPTGCPVLKAVWPGCRDSSGIKRGRGPGPDPHRRAGPGYERFPAPPGSLLEGCARPPPVRAPTRAGKKGRANGYLRGALGQAAIGPPSRDTYSSERYHRGNGTRAAAKPSPPPQRQMARSIRSSSGFFLFF